MKKLGKQSRYFWYLKILRLLSGDNHVIVRVVPIPYKDRKSKLYWFADNGKLMRKMAKALGEYEEKHGKD